MSETWDYIIVGAGSAGCVVANRLSSDPRNRVLLLEAGGRNDDFMVKLPKGMGKLIMDPAYAWHYLNVDGDRGAGVTAQESWVRGKGLGGSSAINGMIYMRGQPEDYAFWASEAGDEWSWPKMKAAYRAIEDHDLGDDGSRGVGGPLHISSGKYSYPLSETIIQAGIQMGLPRKQDLNAEGDQAGVGYYCHNIKNGVRQSASLAFLEPVRSRPNLRIVTGAQVDKVLFTDRRASGVSCRVNGQRTEFHTTGEVILSLGAVHSPKLLQLSGIGPAALLRAHGIDVLHDSPDVGARMRDHLGYTATYRLKGDKGINHRYYGVGLVGSVLQYALTHTGPLATGPFEVGLFLRTTPAEPTPNMQIFAGGLTINVPENNNDPAKLDEVERVPGMTISAELLHLESEGTVQITSADPDAPVRIAPNWLRTEKDQRTAIDMVHRIRELASQPALAPVIDHEVKPGPAIRTEDDMLESVRKMATCGTHAVRSCRMGRDERSVVDERMRVRGVQGLRIVDCSILPGLTSGNTNGPAMASAWRASDLILEDGALRNAG